MGFMLKVASGESIRARQQNTHTQNENPA
jgi:hypothetical protein